ncbi:hypothetical protein JTB14_002673 [Gonioctena quinquepunctata]|nr:hypothetical protein JTB14_002673 [Gonioctena quinquepunctata]
MPLPEIFSCQNIPSKASGKTDGKTSRILQSFSWKNTDAKSANSEGTPKLETSYNTLAQTTSSFAQMMVVDSEEICLFEAFQREEPYPNNNLLDNEENEEEAITVLVTTY